LNGTKVYVDNQYCNAVPNGCKNGSWYDVVCSKPLFGKKIRIVTVQNTYLSIQGFEAYTGDAGSMRTTTRTRTTRNIKMGGNMGGFGGFRRGGSYSMSFSMGNTKVTLNQGTANQASPYGNNGYPARNAFSNGSKFTHTNHGVGMWWKCRF
jgi:hypothetical protein